MNRYRYMIAALIASAVLAFSAPATGQGLEISGVVTDMGTGFPLPGVAVEVRGPGGERVASAVTGSKGRFRVGRLEEVEYTIVFSMLGYETLTVSAIKPSDMPPEGLFVELSVRFALADTIVVSASRRPEPKLRAPAAVSMIDRIELMEQPQMTPVDLTRDVTGVDFASKGIMASTYAMRGARGTTSKAILVLADYRYTGVPVLRYNIPYAMQQTSDDIDRIEIVRGPGAAVYGPNTVQGVFHVITRSPFESQGTTVSLMGGERDVVQGTFRHAGAIGESVAFKISGQALSGQDWEYVDPKEVEYREDDIAAGADPDTLLTAMRDSRIRNYRGDARVDWRAGDNTTVILSGGAANTPSAIEVINTTGAIQVRDWYLAYVQGRLEHGGFRANLMYNWGNTGDSYFLRSGEPSIDKSRIAAAQLQQSFALPARTSLLVGADVRHSDPRTEGTVSGRYEDDDLMNEYGGYFTSTTALHPRLDLVAALRVDYHDRLNDLAVSPRAGLVCEPLDGQALRLTYNRAYNSPEASGLFLDVKAGQLMRGWDMRLVSVPQDGFHWSRDCSGLYCMRSPFNPAGASAPLPADATLLWPVLVARYPALAGVPAPNGSQVGTDLRSYEASTGWFTDEVDVINDLEQTKRNYSTWIEAGYTGSIGRLASLSLDVYWTQTDNFAMGLYGATPNVFIDEADLRDYLVDTGGFDPATAAAYADSAANTPLGTVAPDGDESADVILSYRQEGSYIESRWGVDMTAEITLSRDISAILTYSWISKDFPSVPRNKGSLGLTYRNLRSGIDGGARFRAVESFWVDSGLYHGQIESYNVLDLNLGYRIPSSSSVRVSVNAYNVFDTVHREMLGAPELGRLVMMKVQYEF